LIGMMAAVRKFIVLDLNGVNVRELLALSAAVLSLSAAYWLVRGKAMARVDATTPPPSQTSQDTQPQKN
ncbi:MAG: phosphate-starvation-inducible PsiE family protein, partial [Bombella apis]|nr:phosphate-starvation-inducible PsiE family protein [Bombella apis]